MNKNFGDVQKVLKEFETRPIAAASLGQVHRGKLLEGKDGFEDVAIKI